MSFFYVVWGLGLLVRPTLKPAERFPLDHRAVGYRYAEGAVTRLSGAKNRAVDVNVDVIAESSKCWTSEFVEDATWNVMENMVDNVGRALGEEETSFVLSLYGGIAEGDLAGGAPIDQGGKVMNWKADIEHGLVRSVSGMKVQASTLVPNGTAYAIDTRLAAIMLIRRDIMVEDWSDPLAGEFGVKATTRFGLGVLRGNAVAKMINIKNSL